jgi:hypothetical protein
MDSQQLRNKMKWVSKYISRPLLIIVLLCVVLYYFFPGALQSWGIDVEHLGKYAFWFFAIKGMLWLLIMAYGAYYLWQRKRQ